MLSETEVREIIGTTMYSADGEKIGKIGQVFLDDRTGRPEFATVNTGLFGTNESFVPLAEARMEGDRTTVPYDKDRVKGAPNVDVDGQHLDESEEARLYEYYGLSSSGVDQGTDLSSGRTEGYDESYDTSYGEGHDVSGPETDRAMTRSEERLVAGTQEQEAGRVRLRKYVTTEEETVTVPVRKERAVVEREPITEGNVGAATDGPAISEEEHEVVLREEKPVVGTTAEPVERVRLGTETTTEQETVSGEVRKEHIEVDGDADERR